MLNVSRTFCFVILAAVVNAILSVQKSYFPVLAVGFISGIASHTGTFFLALFFRYVVYAVEYARQRIARFVSGVSGRISLLDRIESTVGSR